MALAGELTQTVTAANQPGVVGYRLLARHTITRITNRAIRIGHRMIGFGTDPMSSLEGGPDSLEAYCRIAPADSWAEMAAELRLRRTVQRAALTE